MTLSGGRQLEFQAVSDLVAELSFATKSFTTQHQKQREIDNQMLAKKINDGRIFTPKIDNLLDDVIDIIDDPNAELMMITDRHTHPHTLFVHCAPHSGSILARYSRVRIQ